MREPTPEDKALQEAADAVFRKAARERREREAREAERKDTETKED